MYTQFSKNTGILFQPNFVYIYNKKNNIFDVFNDTCKDFFIFFNGLYSNEEIIDTLLSKYEVSKDIIEDDLIRLIEYMANLQYIILTEEPKQNKIPFELPDKSDVLKLVNAEIEITNRCNLKCLYCYAESNTITNDKSDDYWVNKLNELHKNGLRSVTFSGGEPFIRKNFLNLLESIKDKFIITINTNGTLLDLEIIKRLETFDIKCLQISLDSLEESYHDKMRGSGTWKKVMKNLQILKYCGIPIRISATITSENQDQIDKLRDFCFQNNFEFSPETLKKCGFAERISEMLLCKFTDHEIIPQKEFAIEVFDTPCQASLGFAAIGADGIIKPCNLTDKYFKLVAPEIYESNQSLSFAQTKTYRIVKEACNHEQNHGKKILSNINYQYSSCVIERFKKYAEMQNEQS